MATPAEYVELVEGTVFPAVRAQLTAWAEHAATLGDPDPDLTAANDTLLGFVDEVGAAGPGVADPANTDPLPPVPPDLPAP